MTRRARINTVAEADARLAQLAPWLSAAGQPRKQVNDLLAIAAVYRGEIDRLQALAGEQKKSGFVDLIEKKRK